MCRRYTKNLTCTSVRAPRVECFSRSLKEILCVNRSFGGLLLYSFKFGNHLQAHVSLFSGSAGAWRRRKDVKLLSLFKITFCPLFSLNYNIFVCIKHKKWDRDNPVNKIVWQSMRKASVFGYHTIKSDLAFQLGCNSLLCWTMTPKTSPWES